jgi:CO dehydrogenase/acetyl-CoA synthase delta subunit
MFVDKQGIIEDTLRDALNDVISDPSERAKVYTVIKRYNHEMIKAVLNDFRLTLTAKEEQILNSFPIE